MSAEGWITIYIVGVFLCSIAAGVVWGNMDSPVFIIAFFWPALVMMILVVAPLAALQWAGTILREQVRRRINRP